MHRTLNNCKNIIQLILFSQHIPAHCLPRKLWSDLGHVKVPLNISIYKTNCRLGIDLGAGGLSHTRGTCVWGPSDALVRARPKRRASRRSQGQWRNTTNEFFMFLGRQMFIFCRFVMVDLAHFGRPHKFLGTLGALPAAFGSVCLAHGSSQGCPWGSVHDIGGSKGGALTANSVTPGESV